MNLNFVLILTIFSSALLAYLLGSINFAIVFTKLLDKKDIRKEGSGNAGFTNTLRCSKKITAVFTFFFDFLKGVVSVKISILFLNLLTYNNKMVISPSLWLFCLYFTGVFCVLGHIKPIFFKFRGGKGALTTSAIALSIDWRVYVFVMLLFLIILFIFKIMSVASILAALTFPVISFIVTFFFDYFKMPQIGFGYVIIATIMPLLMSFVVVCTHKANIIRLKNGTEPKIGCKATSCK